MPNQHNIESPIILISVPRSGTSLLFEIFRLHPDFQAVGETANLLFGTWQSVDFIRGITDPLVEEGRIVSHEERAARVVRQTMLTCFPDHQPYWFQKPIGLPKAVSDKFEYVQRSDAAAWYWEVLGKTFPKARYFTVLRHPCDIVLSSESYLGFEAGTIWWSLAFMSHIISHPASLINYAIHYEELIQHKEQTTRNLFEFLEIPFDNQILNAFNQIHVPSKGREKPEHHSPTRQEQWHQLDPMKVPLYYIEEINTLFAKFGYSVEWPLHFTPERLQIDSSTQTSEEIIGKLHQKIETLQLDRAVEMQNQSLEYQKQIDGLTDQLRSFNQVSLWKFAQKRLLYKYRLWKENFFTLIRRIWVQ